MSVQKLIPKKLYPSLKTLWNRYEEITEAHCKYLLHHLYTHNITEWINPITKKDVQRDSNITISFLSICYWGEWSEKIVTINGINKKYKIHVSNFIHESYLYDVRSLIKPSAQKKISPKSSSPPGAAISTASPPGAAVRTASPPGAAIRTASPPGAAVRTASPPGAAVRTASPPGAATNKPQIQKSSKSRSSSSAKLDISPKSINSITKNTGSLSVNADKLTEDDCIKLVEDIRKMKRGKTAAEIKLLKVINPITKKEIGLKSPIFKGFLSKCYFTFDNNDKLQKSIKKIVNIESLNILKEKRSIFDKEKKDAQIALEKKKEEKRLAEEKEKEERKKNIPIIDKYIEGLVDEFNKCCDELIDNCDKNGVLKEYKYISNVINSIIIVMYTKYLHLPYYYDELYLNYSSQLDLKIYMYDETFSEYYESRGIVPYEVLNKILYGDNKTKYQKHDLTKYVDHTVIDLFPKTIEHYYLNTLLNRQHVFEAFRYDIYANAAGQKKYDNHMIQYNKLNTSYYTRLNFNHYKFPDSLEYAKDTFIMLSINYNITNGTLPKTIFCATKDKIIGTKVPFLELSTIINDRLRKLPNITGIANESSTKHQYYETIIKDMRELSYGNNDTEYGSDDMIRKNILYSLNVQSPKYIEKNMESHKDDIYYNYEYTGTFPLFSWIPLNHKNIDSETNLKYTYPMTKKWQPLFIDTALISQIELTYKNHGVAPFSAHLNETIYKVLTDEYASVKALQIANRIQAMTLRIQNTIGAFKDETIMPNYNNKKIYLYHGTKNTLHSIGGKGKEIEVLGFLSTSLNVYTASFYSGISEHNSGLMYIIEVDDTHTYINLNDNLNQILILPQSRIRIIKEFNMGGLCIILCRLFRTPTVAQNNLLYDKLLDINKKQDVNKYVTYKIKTNNNTMPVCAYMIGELWKTVKEDHYSEELEIYKIKRSNLNNKLINDKWKMTHRERNEDFLYFSLGQEYELYVARGLPLILGSLEDIKYSIHQHFIKDCYKALDIPCLDYIFIHGKNKSKISSAGLSFVKNPISTGILSKDIKNNRTNHFKYNINNFLIDCIFKFDSIKHDNKKLNILGEQDDGKIYADKIEGFRDAGAYLNGVINPLFNKDAHIGEHMLYMRDWKHLFIKYKDASDEDLTNHLIWCHHRIMKLIKIISSVSDNYLLFINETLKGYTKNSNSLGTKESLDPTSREYKELYFMIKNLEGTLLKRAKFYSDFTHIVGGISNFIEFVRDFLGTGSFGALENTHKSKLYKHAIQEELILQKNDSFSGGILSIKDMKKQGMQFKEDSDIVKPIDHAKIYEEFKNVPIAESKDMRKFNDMPKDFQEYYGGGKDEKGKYINAGKYIDISNHCHCRLVDKKDKE